jgi:ribosomal protein L34E
MDAGELAKAPGGAKRMRSAQQAMRTHECQAAGGPSGGVPRAGTQSETGAHSESVPYERKERERENAKLIKRQSIAIMSASLAKSEAL